MKIDWREVDLAITEATNKDFSHADVQPLSGGDINSVYRLQGKHQSYFVKINQPQRLSMFEAEQAGLLEMRATHSVRVPLPIVCAAGGCAFLVLEDLQLQSKSHAADQLLGQQLAQMHLAAQPYYGWHRENTIGLTKQLNGRYESWVAFWREQRLGMQLTLVAEHGYTGRIQDKGEQLMLRLDSLFESYKPSPSLLHGDLWSGNAAADSHGRPVIYDPACYYGDREADIAMTELFGGFGAGFYAAYKDVYALDVGYGSRKILYNLYHVLNHLNLFGRGYLGQAIQMLDQLLAELG